MPRSTGRELLFLASAFVGIGTWGGLSEGERRESGWSEEKLDKKS